MVVVGAALALAEEERVEVAVSGQCAAGGLGEEGVDRTADREVLLTPQQQERQVAEVVVGTDAGVGEAVPGGGGRRGVARVADPGRRSGAGVGRGWVGSGPERGGDSLACGG